MKSAISRRAAIATLGTGIAGMTAAGIALPRTTLAAMSSAAGIFAGGSLEGPNGLVQFSIFATRIQLDDEAEPIIRGAFSWIDPKGLDGEPLLLELVNLADYGRGDNDNTRFMSGTVSVNGEGEEPFGVFLTDNGTIGFETDNIQLAVGPPATGLTGTPIPEEPGSGFTYEAAANITSGNVQLINFT